MWGCHYDFSFSFDSIEFRKSKMSDIFVRLPFIFQFPMTKNVLAALFITKRKTNAIQCKVKNLELHRYMLSCNLITLCRDLNLLENNIR